MTSTRSPVWLLALSAWLSLAAYGVAVAQETSELFSLPPLNDLSATVDKPLFSPERRPPPDAQQSNQPAAASEPSEGSDRQLALAGTATDQSERAVAILHDLSQSTQFRVWVGDEVQGWTVKAIRPRALVLGTATQEVTVTLDEPTIPPAQ
jgi:general secretion pathway protein N